MEQFDSVRTMIDNLRSEDPELRLSSMRGIHLIAATLGPQRTRDELLLYLTDYLDDNDEVLRVFANALGTMVQEVGGIAFTQSLLGPLEMLAGLDEITVRDEAVASLKLIGSTIFATNAAATSGASKQDITRAQDSFTDMIQRLCKGTVQCRSTAAFLIGTVYTASGTPMRNTCMNHFLALCGDEEISVRRSACVAVGEDFAKVLGAKSVDLIPAFTAFAKDGSDGVRLQAVPVAIALLKVLPETQHSTILAALRALATDSSWRVRFMMADKLGVMAGAISSPDVAKYVVPVFRLLCQDAEAEIRASAVFVMDQTLAACNDVPAKREILQAGTRLVSDESAQVRMSLASSVLKAVAHVPKDTWPTTVVPACTTLLADAEADVRLALVSGFSAMGNTSEAKEVAPQLVPAVIALASDPKWRLRETVVAQMPSLITALGQDAEKVLDVCVERLTDRVATIRDTAVLSCCQLVEEHGAAWASSNLFRRVQILVRDTNYLHRVALCHLYGGMGAVAAINAEAIAVDIWPTLSQTLVRDPVINVRLNVALAVRQLLSGGKITERQAETVLAKLRTDGTEDVRDAAATTAAPRAATKP